MSIDKLMWKLKKKSSENQLAMSTVKLWNIVKKNKLDAGIYKHGWHDCFGSYDYLGMDFKYKPYLYLYVKYKLIIFK